MEKKMEENDLGWQMIESHNILWHDGPIVSADIGKYPDGVLRLELKYHLLGNEKEHLKIIAEEGNMGVRWTLEELKSLVSLLEAAQKK